MASLLRLEVRSHNSVARLGGDEFVIMPAGGYDKAAWGKPIGGCLKTDSFRNAIANSGADPEPDAFSCLAFCALVQVRNSGNTQRMAADNLSSIC